MNELIKQKLPYEEWRDIDGYEECYQISNYGRVKNLKRYIESGENLKTVPERILKLEKSSYGYIRCFLQKEGVSKKFSVHRLVALAFIPNPENKPQVNHKDGDKTNNRGENLEWCTASENKKHSYRVLNEVNSSKGKFGFDSHNGKRIHVKVNGKILHFGSILEASRNLNVSYSALRYRGNKINLSKKSKLSHIQVFWDQSLFETGEIIDLTTLK